MIMMEHTRSDGLSRTNLYIRGLKKDETENTLLKRVYESGFTSADVESAKVAAGDGECRGYGFVDFCSEELASQAVERLSEAGLQVNFAKENEKDNTNVYVRNISPEKDDEWLKKFAHNIAVNVIGNDCKVISVRLLTCQEDTSTIVRGFIRLNNEANAAAFIDHVNNTERTAEDFETVSQKKLVAKKADRTKRSNRRNGSISSALMSNSATNLAYLYHNALPQFAPNLICPMKHISLDISQGIPLMLPNSYSNVPPVEYFTNNHYLNPYIALPPATMSVGGMNSSQIIPAAGQFNNNYNTSAAYSPFADPGDNSSYELMKQRTGSSYHTSYSSQQGKYNLPMNMSTKTNVPQHLGVQQEIV